MAIDYDRIKNEAIEEQLLKKESLEQLEDILMRCDTGGMPDKEIPVERKRMLSKNELKETWPEVVSRVDSFLGVEGIKPPKVIYLNSLYKWGYYNYENAIISVLGIMGAGAGVRGVDFLASGLSTGAMEDTLGGIGLGVISALSISNAIKEIKKNKKKDKKPKEPMGTHYNKDLGWVLLKKDYETDIIPAIAHEYAHHLEEMILHPDYDASFYFCEGFARGVQRHISNLYAQERNDPRFTHTISRDTTGELSAVYLWICDRHGEVDRPIPLIKKNNIYMFTADNLDKDSLPYGHAFGNTIFYLAEKRHGDGIYADALKEDVDFLFR